MGGYLPKMGIIKIVTCCLLCNASMDVAFAESKPNHQPCTKLQQVNMHDSIIFLSKNHQQKIFSHYLNKCIDGKLLKSILHDITSFYMQRGYITTRAYLKRQSITDGKIDIHIFNGRIENIIDTKTHASNTKITTAFAFQKGHNLNLRHLETSLEMMNRPTSVQASFTIQPGNKPGESIVQVKDNLAYPYHLKLGLGGRKNMNDKNLYMMGEFISDNPFNINDIFKINYNGSKVQKSYQSNNGVELNYSFPIASYLIEIVGTHFTYRQGVSGINDTYLSSGETQGLRVRINTVLFRNQTNKITGSLSVLQKNTKNYFANQLLEVSSYKSSLAQADLTHTYIQSWGQLTYTYSYYQGTNWFGARSDHYISAETGTRNQAKLQFIKHSFDTNLLYYFSDKHYKFNSNVHIQRTNHLLYDNDKLTVGSDYTVRGYYNRNLFGNNAWYVKNDFTKTWQLNLTPLLQSLSLSAGMDYGEVRCESDNLSSCGSIAGTAVGLSSQSKHLFTNLVWSKPFTKINQTFQMNDLFTFDMTWKF